MTTVVCSISNLTDADLNAARQVGDDDAARVIEYWFEKRGMRGEPQDLQTLADMLMGQESSTLIGELVGLADDLGLDDAIDPRRRTRVAANLGELSPGVELFRDHGLKVMMILIFYSLPAAYAAQNGVRVLHSKHGSTGFLVKDLNRRLVETAQFVLEVFATDALRVDQHVRGGHGRAVEAALRVRLLHSCVRSLIQKHPPPWAAQTLGVPANQEDQAGTLLTFCWLTLDGLEKLGVEITPAERDSYIAVWADVGRLLGVDESLIPKSADDAKTLMAMIKRRQIDAPLEQHLTNDLGKDMTTALLKFIRQTMPWPLRLFPRLPGSVMRFFLPATPVDVPASLGVPPSPVLDTVVRLWFLFEARVTKWAIFDSMNRLVFKEWGGREPRAKAFLQISRYLNKRLVKGIAAVNRNEHLTRPKATPHIELLEWEDTWEFGMSDFVTRGVRLAANSVSRRK